MKRVFLSALFAAAVAVAATWPSFVVGRGRASRDAHVQQRRAACAAEAVSGMPPAELHRADVVHDLQGYASLRARHRKSGRRQDDAAVVCRSDRGALQEHQVADRRRNRDDQRVGARTARLKATRKTSPRPCSSPKGGRSASPTSSSSSRRRFSCRRRALSTSRISS